MRGRKSKAACTATRARKKRGTKIKPFTWAMEARCGERGCISSLFYLFTIICYVALCVCVRVCMCDTLPQVYFHTFVIRLFSQALMRARQRAKEEGRPMPKEEVSGCIFFFFASFFSIFLCCVGCSYTNKKYLHICTCLDPRASRYRTRTSIRCPRLTATIKEGRTYTFSLRCSSKDVSYTIKNTLTDKYLHACVVR